MSDDVSLGESCRVKGGVKSKDQDIIRCKDYNRYIRKHRRRDNMGALIGGIILLVVIVVAVVVGAVSAIVAAAKDTLKDE